MPKRHSGQIRIDRVMHMFHSPKLRSGNLVKMVNRARSSDASLSHTTRPRILLDRQNHDSLHECPRLTIWSKIYSFVISTTLNASFASVFYLWSLAASIIHFSLPTPPQHIGFRSKEWRIYLFTFLSTMPTLTIHMTRSCSERRSISITTPSPYFIDRFSGLLK